MQDPGSKHEGRGQEQRHGNRAHASPAHLAGDGPLTVQQPEGTQGRGTPDHPADLSPDGITRRGGWQLWHREDQEGGRADRRIHPRVAGGPSPGGPAGSPHPSRRTRRRRERHRVPAVAGARHRGIAPRRSGPGSPRPGLSASLDSEEVADGQRPARGNWPPLAFSFGKSPRSMPVPNALALSGPSWGSGLPAELGQ